MLHVIRIYGLGLIFLIFYIFLRPKEALSDAISTVCRLRGNGSPRHGRERLVVSSTDQSPSAKRGLPPQGKWIAEARPGEISRLFDRSVFLGQMRTSSAKEDVSASISDLPNAFKAI
jgi:hypothetical protein